MNNSLKLLIIFFLPVIIANGVFAQETTIPKAKTKTFHAPKTKHPRKNASVYGTTYKIGETNYMSGSQDKNGMPKVKRNTSAKQTYLKSKGYKKFPGAIQ
jgi:hypothetical protein